MEKKIWANGNSRLITRELDATEDGFTAEPVIWEGLVETSLTFSQTINHYPADNNPRYASIASPPTGSGTITLFGIKPSDWKNVLSVIADTKGTRFGEDLPVKFFGLSFDEEVSDGSKNKIILYKVNITDLPSIETSTKSEDNVDPRDVVLNVEVSPVFYDKEDGSRGRVIYDIFNSIENKELFDANGSTIAFPEELV